MIKFIIRRVSTGLLMLFIICSLSFFLFSSGTSRAAYAALNSNSTKESVAAFNRIHGLDKPVILQYFDWLRHAVMLDFGQAWAFSEPVSKLIAERLQTSIIIIGLSILLAGIIAIILGTQAAIRGGWIDRVAQSLSMLSMAIPNYVIALVLVLVFAVNIRIFAATGWVPPHPTFLDYIQDATLPVLAIGLSSASSLTMQIRGSVMDALANDYVRVLRSRGLSYRKVMYKHVLRNAAGPALAIFGMQFVSMLSGLVVIESIFAIPGFGSFSSQATQSVDLPAMMGIVASTAAIVVLVNLVTDILAGALNPKVRL